DAPPQCLTACGAVAVNVGFVVLESHPARLLAPPRASDRSDAGGAQLLVSNAPGASARLSCRFQRDRARWTRGKYGFGTSSKWGKNVGIDFTVSRGASPEAYRQRNPGHPA